MNSIHVFADQETTAAAAARKIVEVIKTNPRAVITFATGNTMIPVYATAAELLKTEKISCSELQAFHLDEYYPCSPTEPHSFVKYLEEHVFVPFGIPLDHRHTMNGAAPDPVAEAARYEALLQQSPVDLSVVGIGPGGHIAFNEKGTPFDSLTHYAKLSDETVTRDRERGQSSPDHCLTQGIATILRSKQIIFIAYGGEKGAVLNQALTGPVSEDCPASILQTVPEKVAYYIDQAAADQLQ